MNSVSNNSIFLQRAFSMPYPPDRQSSPIEPMLPIASSLKRESTHFDTSYTKRHRTAPALPPVGPLALPRRPLIRSRSLLPRASFPKPVSATRDPGVRALSWNDTLICPRPPVNLPHIGQSSPLIAHENMTLPSIHMALELARISSSPVRLRPISSSSSSVARAPSSPTRPVLPLLVPSPGMRDSHLAPNYTYRASIDDRQHCADSIELAQSLIQLSRTMEQPGQIGPYPLAIPSSPHDIAQQTLAYSSQSAPTSFTHSHRRSPHSANSTPTSQFAQSHSERTINASTDLPPLRMRSSHDAMEAVAGSSAAGLSLPLLEQWSPTIRYAPITPPSAKTDLAQSPNRYKNHHHAGVKRCLSCNLDQSPCWRPSWLIKNGQLCNSCGLRYKKTQARCLNMMCKKVPAKGEWAFMQSKGTVTFEDGNEGYSCLECTSRVLVGENGNS